MLTLIGSIPLHALRTHDVRRALSELAALRSSATVALAHNCLARAIQHAESGDHVRRNVAALVKPPPGQAGRPSRAMTADQAAALLQVAQGDDYLGAYVILSLTTGIRTEEARALRWDHVSLDGDPAAGGIPPHMAVWRSVRAGSDTKTERVPADLGTAAQRGRRCGSCGSGKPRLGWRRASCGRITAWSSPAEQLSRWTTRTASSIATYSVSALAVVNRARPSFTECSRPERIRS